MKILQRTVITVFSPQYNSNNSNNNNINNNNYYKALFFTMSHSASQQIQ